MGTEIVQSTQPQHFSLPDLQVMAQNVAASRLFGGAETEQAAFTLMLLCQAEGLHPIQAMRRYHIIKGKPSMRADAMQAEFQRAGGVVRWERSDAEACVARFVHPLHAPEPGVTISLSMVQAREYGLAGNEMYRKFPDQMLRARVISQGVRMVTPGVVVGIYTPEELDQVEPDRPREPARSLPRTEPGAIIDVEAVVEMPESRSAVNEAFKPAGQTPAAKPDRPAHDQERTKLPNDRIGPKGLDLRTWVRVVSEEVGEVNSRLNRYRAGQQLDAAEATNSFEVVRHLVKAATAGGAEDPEAAGPDGKPKRVGIGKLDAHLAGLYASPDWREWLRAELASYLRKKAKEALQVADNEAHGDPPHPEEPVFEAELVHAGPDEGRWPPGRE